jgi:AcrR family transcriptional regulator
MTKARRSAAGNTAGETTRDVLLRVTVAELDEGGEEGVRLETILAEADCSPSSLYHHFGNLRGLVDEAQIVRFERQLAGRTQIVRDAFDRITDREELIQFSIATLKNLFDAEGAESRSSRANALGSTYKRSDFAKKMGLVLQENCDDLAAAFRIAQLRGLILPTIDIRALAVWVQGMLFARVLVELINDDAMEREWDGLTVRAILFTLFGPDAADIPL